MIHPKPLPLSFYVNSLEANTPFSLIRMGDGEFQCIIKREGETCDHQTFSPALAAELVNILLHPRDLIYCLGPRATNQLDIVAFMRRRGLHIEWHDSETLLDASTRGDLLPFVQSLRKHRVIVVGPGHLNPHPAVDAAHFIEVPLTDAFRHRHELLVQVLQWKNQGDVILFSAGPTAKLLVYDLYPELGQTHFLLDIGSLFDWYAGVNSRSYSRKWDAITREQLKSVNLGLE